MDPRTGPGFLWILRNAKDITTTQRKAVSNKQGIPSGHVTLNTMASVFALDESLRQHADVFIATVKKSYHFQVAKILEIDSEVASNWWKNLMIIRD